MILSDAERSTLASVASSVAGKEQVTAVCAYGSKVAGYARPDSDYDLLIVLRRFREGVRYRYLDSPVESSALLVDEELLRQDAQSSYLGEFVVGRLLNVYDPIVNPALLKSVELDYRKRVIVEALLEISSDYGDFAKHILAPYDYFLFDKLSRRASVYPPALYSYVQTYSCSRAPENRAWSTDGFREAAQVLQPRGFLEAGEEGVRIRPEKIRADAFTKVQSLFSDTTRGVTQYAIHGYAGRVGLSVFRREAQSKLKRMRESPQAPQELTKPRSLLRIKEGVIIPSSSLLVKELAHMLGFQSYSTDEKYIGEPYSTTRVLTFVGEGKKGSVVVKHYTDVRSLKWALLGVWASAANKFSMSPLARLDREYGMTGTLRAAGVLTPSILAVAPDERILVKEFVPGPTLSSLIDEILKDGGGSLKEVSEYGRVMAKVHSEGIALGDTKASNVVVGGDGLYLTDLEQAVRGGDMAWDVAEFLYYTAKLSTKEEPMKKVARAFLDSYAGSGGRGVVEKARSPKYVGPFRPFLTPGMAKMLKESMTESS